MTYQYPYEVTPNDVIAEYGKITANTLTRDMITSLGYIGSKKDVELVAETLAEFTGNPDWIAGTRDLHEAIQHNAESLPYLWK